jgi:nucleoside-triphosphatase THEP1
VRGTDARIVILTGERNVGKTNVCRGAVALSQDRGYTCEGLLTASRSDGVRDVLDVRSGRVRRLTVDPGGPHSNSAVVQGRFRFDPETVAWGNDVLARVSTCHLLVVDELGPLEIERGEGWQKAFDVLQDDGFSLALVVVRPELLEQISHRLPARATTVLTVNTHNRDDLPRVLLEMLEKGSGVP